MREALFSLLLVFVSHAITLTSATVLLKSFSISVADLPAKSAVPVDSSGICGALYVADPLDACTSLRFGLRFNETERTRFALIVRGECAFEDKVRNAQNAGFHAAIVFDDRDDRDKGNLIYMMMNPENITVHAIFVSKEAGEMLKEYARGEEGECCIFPSHYEAAWTVLTISFFSFIVICTILVLVLFMPRHRSYSQGMNHRSKSVDAKMVEALPCFVFSSACSRDCHTKETCAICLEDYKDGETLKVLPCRHEFHSSCVDSWLTKWGTFCPVCKHDLRTKIAVLR